MADAAGALVGVEAAVEAVMEAAVVAVVGIVVDAMSSLAMSTAATQPATSLTLSSAAWDQTDGVMCSENANASEMPGDLAVVVDVTNRSRRWSVASQPLRAEAALSRSNSNSLTNSHPTLAVATTVEPSAVAPTVELAAEAAATVNDSSGA